MTGRRVLLHDGDAVLAVDERLRYGPLKAGYHGGGAPAEVVVPIHLLTSGEPPQGWVLAPPQSPPWWRTAAGAQAAEPATQPDAAAPTLFDRPARRADLAAAVVESPAYRDQRSRSARVPLRDEQIAQLLSVLLAAPGHRLDPESAAAALGVAVVQLSGALPMAQRLLNVEQYPVLSRDADGVTIVLDIDLLRDQFGVDR